MVAKGGKRTIKSVVIAAILVMSTATLMSLLGHGVSQPGDNDTVVRGTIFVVFMDGTELPISDVSVSEQPDVTVKLVNLHTGIEYTADVSSGTYTINLKEKGIPSGYTKFKVYAESEGYYDDGRAHAYLDLNIGEVNEHDLYLKKMPEMVEIKGYIKESDTNKGINDVNIIFFNKLDKKEYITSPPNTTGFYKIMLYKGEYEMRVVPTTVPFKYEPYIDRDLEINDETYINVTLTSNESVVIMWTVKGKIVDEDKRSIEANAYLIDMDEMVIAGKDLNTDYLSIRAYPGNFKLVVVADGYIPVIYDNIIIENTTKTIDLDDTVMVKSNVTEEKIATITFNNDLHTGSVSFTIKYAPYSKIPGFDFSEIGNIRLIIDLQREFYNGTEYIAKGTIPDGYIDPEETSLFKRWIKNVFGLPRMNTDEYLVINGTYYNVTNIGNISIEGLENTSVDDTGAIFINYTWDLEVVDPEKLEGDKFTVNVDNLLTSENLEIHFDDSIFEIMNSTIDTSVAEKTDVATVKVWGTTSFSIIKKEKPEIETIKLRYNETDEELKKLKDDETYIVKVGTEVKLHAEVYDTVDHPKGEENDELTYLWEIKGPENYMEHGNDVVINFTVAGEYNITLKAKDTSNEVNESSVILRVDGLAPVIDINVMTFTPSQGSDGTIIINESDASAEVEYKELKINATELYDSIKDADDKLGEVANIVWKYNNGEEETTINGWEPIFRWSEPGEYDIVINVTDVAGHTTEKNLSEFGLRIIVKDRTPPTPKITLNGKEVDFAEDQSVNVSETVVLNASGSFDLVKGEHKDVESFKWKIIEEESGEEMNVPDAMKPEITVTFNEAGKTYIVSLTLADTEGNEVTRNMTVVVKGPLLVIEYINVSKSKPTEGDKLKVSVKINNTGDAPAHNVEVTLKVTYGDKTKTVGTRVIALLNVSEPEILTFTIKSIEYHDKGAKITAIAESPDLPSDISTPELSKSITVKKKELLPTWAIIVIVFVLLAVAIVGAYLHAKRKEEERLLEKAKRRRKGKSRRGEEEE